MSKLITDEEAVEELKKQCKTGFPENDHEQADQIIAELLVSLGYTKTAETYTDMCENFWYA